MHRGSQITVYHRGTEMHRDLLINDYFPVIYRNTLCVSVASVVNNCRVDMPAGGPRKILYIN